MRPAPVFFFKTFLTFSLVDQVISKLSTTLTSLLSLAVSSSKLCPNFSVATLADLICTSNSFVKDGIVTDDGEFHQLDSVICATGYDTSFSNYFVRPFISSLFPETGFLLS